MLFSNVRHQLRRAPYGSNPSRLCMCQSLHGYGEDPVGASHSSLNDCGVGNLELADPRWHHGQLYT
jgi:hypothetical protein